MKNTNSYSSGVRVFASDNLIKVTIVDGKEHVKSLISFPK
mgnify:CR=1 FL=1